MIQPSRGICIYGRSGIGKTTLLGTLPGKGLVVDVPQLEGGTEVLADKADRIDVVTVDEWNDVEDVYRYLAGGGHSYQWVAFDSLTAFQKLARRKAIRERDLTADPHATTQQDWGKIGELTNELIYRFRTLKLLTVWIAQERRHNQDGDGNTLVGPDVSPMSLNALMPSMLLVARLFAANTLAGTVERHFLLGPSPNFLTKYRSIPSIGVPDTIRNANLEIVLKFLLGKVGDDALDVVDSSGSLLVID